jgi:hypothetical protein
VVSGAADPALIVEVNRSKLGTILHLILHFSNALTRIGTIRFWLHVSNAIRDTFLSHARSNLFATRD